MATKQPDPRSQVFDAIMDEWVRHQEDIERLVLRIEEEKVKWKAKAAGRRTWSFELDLNRWAREGCRRRPGWESPEVGLRVYRQPGWSADAFVTVPDCDPAPVEIKLVTNVTEDKYLDEINRDTDKLAAESRYPGLQIVACFETFDLEKANSWTSWLPRVHVWNQETRLVFRRKILEEGLMLVKGWAIPLAVSSGVRGEK